MAGLPVDRIRGLGGQLGEKVKAQGCETVGDLAAKSEAWCQKSFGEKTGRWLFRMARGLDDEPVKDRPLSLSVSNGKTFRGAQVIDDAAAGCDWLAIMVGEINSRVEQMARQHQRAPKTLTLTIQSSRATNTTGAVSRSVRYRPGGAGGAPPRRAEAPQNVGFGAARPARDSRAAAERVAVRAGPGRGGQLGGAEELPLGRGWGRGRACRAAAAAGVSTGQAEGKRRAVEVPEREDGGGKKDGGRR